MGLDNMNYTKIENKMTTVDSLVCKDPKEDRSN